MALPPPSRPPRRPARETSPRAGAATTADRERHRRAVRQRRLVALTALVAIIAGLAVLIADVGSTSRAPVSRRPIPHRPLARAPRGGGPPSRGARVRHPARPRPPQSFAVGVTTMRIVDATRSVSLPDGKTVPRTLVTYVRYPALGAPSGNDIREAPPARAAGPFPLIVFGHGFAVTPGLYGRLLDAWARAGYVVAAPVFPLGNANAPGGPNESDLPNQPADMRLVISRLLAADAASSGPLSGLIAARQIAVAGQSDGGDTALAAAYDPPYRDHRVGAAVILSGAEIPTIPAFQIASGGPPLLAVQGTADPINLPSATDAFYDTAPAPKYRLELLGASHLPPYSSEEPQLRIVERATTAFLDLYLKHIAQAQRRLLRVGAVPGVAALDADP